MLYLGIEIGGTKLQLGVGPGDGTLKALWRGTVDAAAGGEGIRRQITAVVPELLRNAAVDRSQLKGVGIGFGGPVDDATRTVIKSHQIAGWDNFPLADWISEMLGLPTALGNDADVAGLAEALFGAGKGLSPVFYMTIGSGIGGGLIIDGEIYRGCGRGAAEVGHLGVTDYCVIASGSDFSLGTKREILENIASGWAIERDVKEALARGEGQHSLLMRLVGGRPELVTARHVGQAAAEECEFSDHVLRRVLLALSDGLSQVITLLCPRRIVIGGGVSLLGEQLLFQPLRALVAECAFRPFAGCYDIVPAALGEEVVVHGALALARRRLSR